MGKKGGEEDALPLFETKEARFVAAYKLLAFTVFVGICLIWVYRLTHMPRAGEQGRWAWVGMFMAELCYGLYWILTQSCRFKVVYHYPFKERLSYRYKDQLPSVDIFVCTADPKMEPPTLVINTIFSVMSYNYPPEKLSIYLSDDGSSELTFYALLEASSFSKHWIPFCKKFNIQPRSPSAYFAQQIDVQDITYDQEWLAMKKLYKEMEDRIDSVVEMGKIPKEARDRHKGFLEWNSKVTKQDHHSIVQIIIDGRDKTVMDIDGGRLPTLVYMAREKRPQWPHNFKAGAMNALVKSLWFLPIAYVFVAQNACGIAEALSCGDTLIAWWNSQRMWVFRRTTSYFFGFIDVVRWQLGLSKTTFTITTKVNTEDVLKRYEQEVIEFGSSTIMFTIIASLALLHLFSLIGGITKNVLELEFKSLEQLILQVILNLLLVMINIPVYQALFIRRDNGRLPSSILFKSFVLASLACLMPII